MVSYGYGSFREGQRYRITRGRSREYTCMSCGAWMTGNDNCSPGNCYRCVQKRNDEDQAKRLKGLPVEDDE